MALASRASVALTIVPRCSKYLSQKSTFPRHDSIKLEVQDWYIPWKYYVKFSVVFFIGQGNDFLTMRSRYYYIVARPYDCWPLLEKRTSHGEKVSYGHAYQHS